MRVILGAYLPQPVVKDNSHFFDPASRSSRLQPTLMVKHTVLRLDPLVLWFRPHDVSETVDQLFLR